MDLEFKKYKKTNNPGYGKTTVKITLRNFVFSSVAYRKYFEKKKFVELYWDEKNAVIGMMPLDDENEDTFLIKCYRQEISPVAIINASGFIRENGLEKYIKDKSKFEIEEDGKMIMVKLRK
jgi:hypothetical protein